MPRIQAVPDFPKEPKPKRSRNAKVTRSVRRQPLDTSGSLIYFNMNRREMVMIVREAETLEHEAEKHVTLNNFTMGTATDLSRRAATAIMHLIPTVE